MDLNIWIAIIVAILCTVAFIIADALLIRKNRKIEKEDAAEEESEEVEDGTDAEPKEVIYTICLEHIYRPGFAKFTFTDYAEYQQALEVLQKEIGHDFIWTRPLPENTMSINLKYFSEVQGFIEEE